MKPIALQLYTLRKAANADFPSVLRRVAEIGYRGVESVGLFGHNPAEIAGILKDLGLEVCSSHITMPNRENVQQIVETEQALGNTRVISGFGPNHFKTLDDCKVAAASFNEAAELLKPYGIDFGIHNHWWEFETVDGTLVYDVLMRECPSIFGEIDVYWAAYAGCDPAEVVTTYKSRTPLLHIKDGTLKKDAPHLPVGSGVLNIPSIINAADPDTLKWLIVELDEYSGDMFEAVKQSYDYLTSHDLAEGRMQR